MVMLSVLVTRRGLSLTVVSILLLNPVGRVLYREAYLGDAVLRRAFYLAALTAIKVNPIIKRFYEEHKENLKGKKLITACARKLAVITWAVLYYNKPFDASE
ncbi:Second ORF in transposon ISC1190 [Saccharolobus solfataricus P2]|uniref:Second ORF in transposon ISC1190 n=1 Tax=Saccharolobus solfataricus (strain ATCC 35092 / DSM 1617 / JCM 11322 / P2) TaxID=273057 RepID=Q97UU9_SACS2|nr:Second ORF in transposon ISC1190 [Saccharolobus solfataricus P2]